MLTGDARSRSLERRNITAGWGPYSWHAVTALSYRIVRPNYVRVTKRAGADIAQ